MNIQHKKSAEAADPVMSGGVEAKKFLDKNGTSIIIVSAVVLILVGIGLFLSSMRESNIRKAQELFGIGVLDYNSDQHDRALEALSQVVNGYKNTPPAQMSAFLAGSIYLGRQNADEAIVWFEVAARGSKAGFVRAQALEGLAAAYEEKGDAAAAVTYLERALADKSAAHRHAAIRWKLALLNKDNAGKAGAICKDIIADTLASAYHQKAENLLAVLSAGL